MSKNVMGKSRKPGNAYLTVSANGWSWEILKLYKSVANSEKDGYARAFCFVKSPFVPDGEYGDVYLKDIASSVGRDVLFNKLMRVEQDVYAKGL